MTSFLGCSIWAPANHVVYHVASGMQCVGLLVPDSKYGALLLHGLTCLGFLLMSIWSWVILCAPDFFSWNLTLLILNGVQTLSILYGIRPISFPPDLEAVYVSLFRPLRVNRLLFKRMVSPEFCTLMTLNDGEAYAIQSVTRTDKLGLLVSGVMNAYSNHSLLHSISEKQFIDSPEFESTLTGDDKFQVSIVASGVCRYLLWPRQSLEYLLAKDPYLACVIKTLIGRDITNKLYALNEKVSTPAGSRLDIRLPSIPRILKQRKDLRRALAGAMENDALVTDREEEATDSEPENDLGKQSDAAESYTATCDGGWDMEIKEGVIGSKDSCSGVNNRTNKRHIRTKTNTRLLKRCVWSLRMREVQSWTMSKEMVKKLLGARMWLLRRMLRTQRRQNILGYVELS